VAVPVLPAAGATVTVRLAPVPPSAMPDSGSTFVLDELALTTRLPAAVWASPTVNGRAADAAFAGTVRSATSVIVGAVVGPATLEIVGAVLFGSGTVITNVSRAVAPAASRTVRVTVAVPVWPAAGVRATVRSAPIPPRTIPACGSRLGLLDVAVTVRLPGAVW